jgi:hypothetical protein
MKGARPEQAINSLNQLSGGENWRINVDERLHTCLEPVIQEMSCSKEIIDVGSRLESIARPHHGKAPVVNRID